MAYHQVLGIRGSCLAGDVASSDQPCTTSLADKWKRSSSFSFRQRQCLAPDEAGAGRRREWLAHLGVARGAPTPPEAVTMKWLRTVPKAKGTHCLVHGREGELLQKYRRFDMFVISGLGEITRTLENSDSQAEEAWECHNEIRQVAPCRRD